MALTMVHLLAADRWADGHPEYKQSPEFYYGVISPDAIHIRDGGDKSHKNEVHLNNWASPHPEDVVAYWREHAEPFDIGYGVHVLTDAQWVPRYRKLIPGILLPDGTMNIDIYYNDTFVTDFKLLQAVPRLGELLDLLDRAETPTDHPMLTDSVFIQWRRLIQEAYHGQCPYGAPVRFIDEAYVMDFVRDCVALIERTYLAFRGEAAAV